MVRELGGGGMSRVFLADDLALQRAVVIKVLHPELAAGVNADRFNREVLLSARLQHPHIVPVLTAGDVAGLPYYVMPFVKGDTVRARIALGPMPTAEVADILADVAKALAYAHSEGVVHRDIKPDNILLSGGAATVADFGIAKALSSARAQASDGALTSLGTSLGTPAYMAPEQVAGDPDTDHRADIYSLGCVAYEMLTGQTPFAGKSPQQMLAAQVMEKPVPVNERRKDVPPMLAALVMRCLEKEPSRRPQSASEIASPLEQTGAYLVVPSAPSSNWRRVAIIAASAAFIAAIIGVPIAIRRKAPIAPTSSLNLAVAPFEVLDPQLALWKEGIVDVLSRNLDGAGPIRALSPSVTIKRWDGHAERAAAVAFGKKVGAQLVIYGQLQSSGHDLVNAKLWIVDAERDAQPVEIEVRDSISRMDRVSDSLSFRSLAAIGRMRTIGAARLSSLGSSSLPAIRAFLQGAQYFRRAQWDSATTALVEATNIDSTFGIAYGMLGEAYGWMGSGDPRQWAAMRKAGEQVRPGLSLHDSLTLMSLKHYAHASTMGAARVGEMTQAYRAAAAVVDRYPDDAAAWYSYADMRYHNDRTLNERDARMMFDKAIAADSDFAPAYIHAIELAYRNGPEVGRRYATAYLSRAQSADQRAITQFAMLLADGKLQGDKLAATLDTLSPEVGINALGALRRLPDSAEVVITLLRTAAKRNVPRTRMYLADELGFRGHVAESWRLALETSAYTAAELAILGLVPPDSARLLAPWLQRQNDASFYALPALAATRDTAMLSKVVVKATQLAKSDTSTKQRAALAYFVHAANAYHALAKGDSSAALALFEAFNDSVLSLPIDQFVRARLLERTDPRRALDLLGRMTSTSDILYTARQLERGRIAERINEREQAVDAYAFVVAAWRNADAGPLRDAVKEATAALTRLDSDGRLRANLIATH
ncbi:MAG: serine/threonine-protein kinase [bacterium]